MKVVLTQNTKAIQFIKNEKRRRIADFFSIYGGAFGVGIIPIMSSFFLLPLTGIVCIFFLFFPFVLISSLRGGMKAGIVTSVVATVGIAYIVVDFFGATYQVLPIISIAILLTEGLLISYIINRTHFLPKLVEYERREKKSLELVSQLNEQYSKALMEIKARDEFLSIASHELKTPLTSMLLQIQTAIHNIKSVSLANFSVENLLKMLNSTEQQSNRLSKMINDLLNVSLITTGRLDLEREEMDLVLIVKDVLNRFSEKLSREGYNVQLDASKPVIGKWDKLRLEQVVTNLISNAMKYGNKKPIHITVANNGYKADLVVKDKGIGIDNQKLTKVFQRFKRAVSSPMYEGLGVGLYISHQIIKAHKGTIKVESKIGQGSTFTVELPK